MMTVPWYFWYARLALYAMPTVLFDPIMRFVGACSGMSTFKGRGIDWSMLSHKPKAQ